MKRHEIAAWAAQRHFLSVEIDGPVMRIMPLSYEPVVPRNAEGGTVGLPVEVRLPR
jgi:hypothetical protein